MIWINEIVKQKKKNKQTNLNTNMVEVNNSRKNKQTNLNTNEMEMTMLICIS